MSDETSRADAADEEREGLTLERYAEVMAHMRHFPRGNGPEVLARLGLTGQRWESAVLAWTYALAEESAMEEETLSTRFGTTFARMRTRLGEERPKLPSLGLLPEENALMAAPASVPIETAPVLVPDPVASRIELPSYRVAASASTPLLQVPALAPFSTVPLPMHRPVLQPRAHPGEQGGNAPSPVEMGLPRATDTASSLGPSWIPAGMVEFVSVQGTQPSSEVRARPALPFEPARSPQSALENALAEAARFQGPAPSSTMDDGLGETMELGSLRPLLKPELPFSPSSAPIPVHAPALSIERYASLCVELCATPADAEQTRRRYQLTEQEWITLDAHWKARLAREPGARMAWENACSAYRAWLAQAGRGKR